MTSDAMDLSRILYDTEAVEVISPIKQPSHSDAALWYARVYRFPVFPIVPRGKKPLTTHGFLDATLDTARILDWWRQWPDANLGTPTGSDGCGYDVIDVDGPRGRETLLGAGPLPEVRAIAFTPGDGVDRKPGRHLYVAATGDRATNNIAPGIDYKGAGGYVVLPPSVALHGPRYAWLAEPRRP